METSTAVRQKIVSLNPATGETLAEFDPASDAEVLAAVTAAKEAAPAWQQLGCEKRAKFLLRLKDAV